MVETKNRASRIQIETELSRDLGLPSALAIGIGTMIAAGIFTLSGLAVRDVGSSAILSFLAAAIVSTFTALTFCEFASIYPESGGGYLYVRQTFRPIFAYFVGWALYLGYTSSCGFYIVSLSTYFNEFIWHAPYQGAAGVVSLVILTLINIKGTKESAHFQIAVTLAKVVLIIWFVTAGLRHVNIDEVAQRISTDFMAIGRTAAMVFITFFGYSAIAASAGEIKNPVKTIPRAILISMATVTVLYLFVVLVMISAELTEYTEAAMGNAARMFLGPVGGMVIVGGALFSMISASNASILAGSRVMLSMSWLRQLPRGFGAVNPRTRTPIVSLVLVSGTILLFALALPLEDLAHFADAVLLLSLILVNAALIVHRRKHPSIERPFRVPLVPVIPALGILANLYLLVQLVPHPGPVILACACLVLGVIGYITWQGTIAGEAALPGAPSRVALERSATAGDHPFRVLVPLANPANVTQLIDLAAAIAAERQGEIVALRVAVIPEQLTPSRELAYVEREREIMELAHAAALKYEVPVTSLVRVGHDAARAILETASERDCNLIIMGWKGHTTTKEKILGEVVDDVVSHVQADMMLVKQVTGKPLRDFLLPMAGGEHAHCAEQYVASLVRQHEGSLTVCSVAAPDLPFESLELVNRRVADAVERVTSDGDIDASSTLIRTRSVTEGIVERSEEYDAIVIGAAGGRRYSNKLFGTIPEDIAKRSKRTVILVRHHNPVRALWGRVMRRKS